MTPEQRMALESAAWRTLVGHLQKRTDVQNIDLMNLAGFCRNCMSRWMAHAATAQGVALTEPEARDIIYGMPHSEWKARYQKEASAEQKARYNALGPDDITD